MPPLMNPTPKTIACQFGGARYSFQPNEIKEVFDNYAARHMINRWGKYGLVDMTFTKADGMRYKEFDVFEHFKKIQGLENLLKTLQTSLMNFDIYEKETGDKISIQKFTLQGKKSEVEAEVVIVKAEIAKMKKQNPVKTPAQRKALLLAQIKKLDDEMKLLDQESLNGNNAPRPS